MFKDKVVIVTGGGSGIGRALSHKLASFGAVVYVLGNHREQIKEVVNEINHKGFNANDLHLDVRDYEEYLKSATFVFDKHGRIDYLFNNAGITLLSEFQNTDRHASKEVVDINLMGVINGLHAIYPLMVQQGFGHIVNTASLAGITDYPTSSVYAATKSAVLSLSKSLRIEAEELGIKISVACPGYVDTNIFKHERIIGTSRDNVIDGLPFEMIPPAKAAEKILKGIEKNRSVIIFPLYAKLTAFVAVACPFLLRMKYKQLVRAFRMPNN